MKEWLTTGQMIDRLKVGEVAVCSLDVNDLAVKKTHDGRIVHTESSKGHLVLSFDTNNKWRILPKYVSFKEAMKAVEEGKKAYWHYEDAKFFISKATMFDTIVDVCDDSGLSIPTIKEFFEGEWTIED